MRSKTSYFNATLFKKNLTRYWPLWGAASLGGAMLPLAMLVSLVHGSMYGGTILKPLEITEVYYDVLSYAVPVVSIIYAALCAMAVWNYLYNNRSVGLMHTLPIRREGLFLTGVASGLAMMVIPYAVTGTLTILVTSFWGGFEPVGILVTILGVLGNTVFFFGLATFCAFIVGNVFMLPALYVLFNFIAVLTDWMVNMFARGFCFGLDSDYSGVVEWLSPVVYLMQNVRPDCTYVDETVRGISGTHIRSTLTDVTLKNGWLIAVYAAVGVVLLALAWLMYRRRRSESAGDVVSVGWMKPVFRYGWAAYSAILGGRLLYALFWESFQNGDYFSPVPLTLCMIVGGAVGYFAASMLLAKTPRVFKRTWKGMVAVALGCAALCVVMKTDALGVVRRVPGPDSIRQVQLYAADSNYYLTTGQDDALIEELRTLHQAIIADEDRIVRDDVWELYVGDEENQITYQYIRMIYTLNSGLTVERRYNVPLVRQRMAEHGTYDSLLDQLINSPAMRQKRIRWQDESFQMDGAWLNTRNGSVTLGTREVDTLLAAVTRDAANGSWGVYDWFVGRSDADAYAIRLNIDYRMKDTDRYDGVSITVREGMTETIAALKELKLITEEELITEAELYPWQYIDNGWEEYDRFCEKFGMDPEEYYSRHGAYPDGWFDGTGYQSGGSGEVTTVERPAEDYELYGVNNDPNSFPAVVFEPGSL